MKDEEKFANLVQPDTDQLAELSDTLGQNWEKIVALGAFLELDYEEHPRITERNDETYQYGRTTYLVLEDHEADKAFNSWMENFIEEQVLTCIPEAYQNYFDKEKYKHQELRYCGRGSLAADGEENEKNVNGTTYFIYET